MNRGDIVLADFPFQDTAESKIRPAVVVQNDIDNQSSMNTVLAMITGNLRDASHPAAVFIDPLAGDGMGCGLRGPSLIKCGNLATVRQQRILRVIGQLRQEMLERVNHGLLTALQLHPLDK